MARGPDRSTALSEIIVLYSIPRVRRKRQTQDYETVLVLTSLPCFSLISHQVHVALAVSFIRSGYIGGGSAGDAGAAGAGGGGSNALSMDEATVGDADATAAIYALLNRQAAMEKAVLGEKPSERSETLRNLAQNEAGFWVDYIYAGTLFGSGRWEAEQAAKRSAAIESSMVTVA